MPGVVERPADKRLTLIWGEKPNAQMLTLLRSQESDERIQMRERVQVMHGPQPCKHNHYTDDQFYRHDAAAGVVRNVYGQRIIRVTEDFIVAVLGGLEEEVGDAAGEIMYRCGYEWGMEDMKSFAGRVQAEFEVEMSKMNMGMLLDTWWWPLQIEGWGGWRYDFRQGKQGLIFVDLFESAVAQSLGDVGKVVCYFYAGLFAAVFSVLAKRQLACIEIQCYAMGEDYCKFLVSTDKRVNAAQFWRNEGATSKDILKKLQSVS
jgi:predicted hydrocarbon binding protein